MKTFNTDVDHSFGYTPDTAYFTLDGMFRQGLGEEAAELTLNHLANYNYHEDWQIPVAPEAYQRDLTLFGDQYSNFNAGKILLYLEGLAGLKVSVPDRQLTIRPACPRAGIGWRSGFRLRINGRRYDTPKTGSRSAAARFRLPMKLSKNKATNKAVRLSANTAVDLLRSGWLDAAWAFP